MKNTKYMLSAVMVALLGCGIMMDANGAAPQKTLPSDLKAMEAEASGKLLPSDKLKIILKNRFNPETGVLDASNIWLQASGSNKDSVFPGIEVLGELLTELPVKNLVLTNNRLSALGMHSLCGIIKGLPKDKQQELECITCDGNWIGDLSAIELIEIANDDMLRPKSGKRVVKLGGLGLRYKQEIHLEGFLGSREFPNLELLGSYNRFVKSKSKANPVGTKDNPMMKASPVVTQGTLVAETKSAQPAELVELKNEPMVIHIKNEEDVSKMRNLETKTSLRISFDDKLLALSIMGVFIQLTKNKDMITSLEFTLPETCDDLTLGMIGNCLNQGTYPVVLHVSTDKELTNAEKVKEKCKRVEIEQSMVMHIQDSEEAHKLKLHKLKTKTSLTVSLGDKLLMSSVALVSKWLTNNKDMIASLELKLPEAYDDLMLKVIGIDLEKGTYPVIIHVSNEKEFINAKKIKAKCSRVEIKWTI